MSAGAPSRLAVGLVALGLVVAACDGGDPPDASPVSDVTVANDGEVAQQGAATTPPSSTTEREDTPAPTTDAPAPTPTPNESTDVDRPPVPDGSGGEATGPLSSADVDVATDEGTVQIGDAEIPASAAGFPVPEGLDVELASDIGTDAGFSGVAPGTVSDVAGFYRSALPEAGYDIIEDRSPGESDEPTVVLLSFESAGQAGDIAISSAPGSGTAIIVTIADR